MAMIIPFWIKGIVMDQSIIEQTIYAVKTKPVNVDLFNLGKARLLMFGVSMLLMELLYLILRHRIVITWHPLLWGVVVFYACIILATVMSPYREVVYVGFSDRYEGFYVYSYYISLVFLSFFLLTNRRMIRQVLSGLMVSVGGVFIIGILEVYNIEIGIYRPFRPWIFWGTDSVNEGFVDLFYTLYQGRMKPGFQFVTGPLFNPNYLGVYGGVMVILGLGLILTETSKLKSIIYGMLTGMAYCVLLLSGANTSFYLTLVVASIQCIYVMIKRHEVNQTVGGYKKKLVGILGSMIILFILINGLSEGAVYKEFVLKYLPSIGNEKDSVAHSNNGIIENIEFEGDTIIFDDGRDRVSFVVEGQDIEVSLDETSMKNLEGWQFDVGTDDEPYIFKYHGKTIYLGMDDKGDIGVLTSQGLVQELSPRIPLRINGRAFSNRGYIWSIAIKFIGEQLIIGHGPDTYPIYQPKGDLLNLLEFRSSTSSTSINPHNVYLQWGFISGIVGLLSMLVSLLGIVYQGAKRMKRGDLMGLYVFMPLILFLGTSFLNDTIVGTGFILFLLIGMVFAWLYNQQDQTIYRKNSKEIE